ncbi:hypothetical protein ACH5AO_24020 [Streptomyces sp. NPDC018964]|uniref:hypothetical protein n=1 Tax=Streptomyces sp. NPDC018964 TaxID=3365058 RepID=UPI0037A9E343
MATRVDPRWRIWQIKPLAGIWHIDQLTGEIPGGARQGLSCGDGANESADPDWTEAELSAGHLFGPGEVTRHRRVMAHRGLSSPEEVTCWR